MNKNSGLGFMGLLALIFITLKLTGHISWSWWGVLAPIYAPFLVVVALILIIGVIKIIRA